LALKKLLLALAVFWTLVIAVLCLVSFREMPTVSLKSADKYVHTTFHFVFTILWFFALYQNTAIKKSLARVFLLSFGYGILIEILQSTFTQTRKADVYDVFANATGAVLAILVLYFYDNYLKRKAL